MTVKKLYFIPAGRCMLDRSSVNSALTPETIKLAGVVLSFGDGRRLYFSRHRYARKCS